MMTKLKDWLKRDWQETKLLFRGLPAAVLSIYVLTVVLMNILAASELVHIGEDSGMWFALDAGIFLSWLVFMLCDMIVKRFGAKAAMKVAVFGMLINLAFCGLVTIIAAIITSAGSNYGEGLAYLGSYVGFSVNEAGTFSLDGSAWHIILGSAFAFIVSAVLDALIHVAIKSLFKKNPNGLGAHIASAWGSTAIGQFVDNLVFAFTVSIFLFGWSPLACVTCALTGAIAELLCQVVFTPIGYRVATRWEKEKVGQEYVDFVG